MAAKLEASRLEKDIPAFHFFLFRTFELAMRTEAREGHSRISWAIVEESTSYAPRIISTTSFI